MIEYRLDDLELIGRNGKPLRIKQNPKWFCFGIDAVLLANFARVKPGDTVLDMCTGSGVIPAIISAKTKAKHIDAVEIQDDIYNMAVETAKMNESTDYISIIKSDIKTYKGDKLYNCVTCNPPYKEISGGTISDNNHLAIARNEVLCNLKDVCQCASRNLKFGGLFFMVHRPERLCDIVSFMRESNIEPKRIRPVHSYGDKGPVMLLIEGRKGGNPKLIFENPLVIYNENGDYTDEINNIYGRNA